MKITTKALLIILGELFPKANMEFDIVKSSLDDEKFLYIYAHGPPENGGGTLAHSLTKDELHYCDPHWKKMIESVVDSKKHNDPMLFSDENLEKQIASVKNISV